MYLEEQLFVLCYQQIGVCIAYHRKMRTNWLSVWSGCRVLIDKCKVKVNYLPSKCDLQFRCFHIRQSSCRLVNVVGHAISENVTTIAISFYYQPRSGWVLGWRRWRRRRRRRRRGPRFAFLNIVTTISEWKSI